MHAKVVRYFVEVVRAGSIRKAAAQLHVVPTAINRQILNLEEELGAPLFERIHNTLKLTPVGELVLAHARGTLREFDGVRQRIEAMRGLRQGEVTLATTAGLADAFLPGVVRRFRAAHPGIQLKLLGLPIAAVLHGVREGDADLALAYDVPATAGFRTLFASEWPIGAVVPPGHALTAHASTVLAECVGHPLLLSAPSLSIRPIIDAAFERSGLRASPVIETTSTALMRRLVREGEGITLLNRLDVAEEMHDGSLVFVPLRDATLPAQTLTLETRAAQAPSPAAELFANHVTACLDELLAP